MSTSLSTHFKPTCENLEQLILDKNQEIQKAQASIQILKERYTHIEIEHARLEREARRAYDVYMIYVRRDENCDSRNRRFLWDYAFYQVTGNDAQDIISASHASNRKTREWNEARLEKKRFLTLFTEAQAHIKHLSTELSDYQKQLKRLEPKTCCIIL